MFRDYLTGLYNRRFINEHLSDWLAQHSQENQPVALLFLDVDKFKAINDGFGHSVGDQAIQHVANWLASETRTEDLAIRLGGDEFLVILNIEDEETFQTAANRIAEGIPPLKVEGVSLAISLSVGATFLQPVPGETIDANKLIDQSDQLMYRAKRAGGGTVSMQSITGLETIDSCVDA